MAGKWCTVSTTDAAGRRYSLDVEAASTYDAAHIYIGYLMKHSHGWIGSSISAATARTNLVIPFLWNGSKIHSCHIGQTSFVKVVTEITRESSR